MLNKFIKLFFSQEGEKRNQTSYTLDTVKTPRSTNMFEFGVVYELE